MTLLDLSDSALLAATRALAPDDEHPTFVCEVCGGEYPVPEHMTARHMRWCDDCREEATGRARRRPHLPGMWTWERQADSFAWVVVSDPLPYEAGGYRPGARFSEQDMRVMRQSGQGLTIGMVLERAGRRYRVALQEHIKRNEAVVMVEVEG